MGLQTGENEQGLKQIIDLMRAVALVVLALHCYYFCFAWFKSLGWSSTLSKRILSNIVRTGLFSSFHRSKWLALGLLLLSLIGVRARKNESANIRTAVILFATGLVLYFMSVLFLQISTLSAGAAGISYLASTWSGVLLIITGGATLAGMVKTRLSGDVFNRDNETFPQEEHLIENEFSINLPATYRLNGQIRKSWINLIAPARGVLCVGSPGSGKSRYVVEPAIRQLLAKGHTMCLYDFKYPDLTNIAYATYLNSLSAFPVKPEFVVINFDDPAQSHRCNPLDPGNMEDITDAVEAARTLMLGTNRSWLKKQGDFFVESAINFVVAIIWFLKKYDHGKYCTLPHAIELMQVKLDKLLTVLQTELEIMPYISSFISAYQENAMEQLEGQIDAAKVGLARLSSAKLYYVLSANDYTLDLNNPEAPKIICLANNPQKQEVYGPVLSLFMTRISKIINRPNQLKSAVVLDEFPTLTFLGLDTQIATGRSNLITTILAMQSDHQLKLNYGKEWADVITNICGNIIIGQTSGDLAKTVSERIGKMLQTKESISINAADTSVSKSKHLEAAVPVSTIASLSAGEFVGLVSDTPTHIIPLKAFHSSFKVQPANGQVDKKDYGSATLFDRQATVDIKNAYVQIKDDILNILASANI